jgi:hypothetical protein
MGGELWLLLLLEFAFSVCDWAGHVGVLYVSVLRPLPYVLEGGAGVDVEVEVAAGTGIEAGTEVVLEVEEVVVAA